MATGSRTHAPNDETANCSSCDSALFEVVKHCPFCGAAQRVRLPDTPFHFHAKALPPSKDSNALSKDEISTAPIPPGGFWGPSPIEVQKRQQPTAPPDHCLEGRSTNSTVESRAPAALVVERSENRHPDSNANQETGKHPKAGRARFWLLVGIGVAVLIYTGNQRPAPLPPSPSTPAVRETQFEGGRFKGHIDGRYEIRLDIRRAGSVLDGTYVYTNFNNSVRIMGFIDDTGHFELRGTHNGVLIDVFYGRVQQGGQKLSGEYVRQNDKRRMPFTLDRI